MSININLDEFKGLIKETEDKTDSNMDRLRLTFNNGYQLSIIIGEYSYGGEDGFYEIAPYNKEGKMDGSLLGENDYGDDVMGYLSESEVKEHIERIGNLK